MLRAGAAFYNFEADGKNYVSQVLHEIHVRLLIVARKQISVSTKSLIPWKLVSCFPRGFGEQGNEPNYIRGIWFKSHTKFIFSFGGQGHKPCKLNISCISTTAESRVKVWYQ